MSVWMFNEALKYIESLFEIFISFESKGNVLCCKISVDIFSLYRQLTSIDSCFIYHEKCIAIFNNISFTRYYF